MNIVLTGFAARAEAATVGTFKELANLPTAPTNPYPAADIGKFVPGEIYSTRSICDHDCIFRWKVIKRTEMCYPPGQVQYVPGADSREARGMKFAATTDAEVRVFTLRDLRL